MYTIYPNVIYSEAKPLVIILAFVRSKSPRNPLHLAANGLRKTYSGLKVASIQVFECEFRVLLFTQFTRKYRFDPTLQI